MKCLFLGGPADGRLLYVTGKLPYWKVAVDGMDSRGGVVEYRRERLTDGQAYWDVYVHGDIEPMKAKTLIGEAGIRPDGHIWPELH